MLKTKFESIRDVIALPKTHRKVTADGCAFAGVAHSVEEYSWGGAGGLICTVGIG
jgi:hypothetical protein